MEIIYQVFLFKSLLIVQDTESHWLILYCNTKNDCFVSLAKDNLWFLWGQGDGGKRKDYNSYIR